jgi:hypothetical protein
MTTGETPAASQQRQQQHCRVPVRLLAMVTGTGTGKQETTVDGGPEEEVGEVEVVGPEPRRRRWLLSWLR